MACIFFSNVSCFSCDTMKERELIFVYYNVCYELYPTKVPSTSCTCKITQQQQQKHYISTTSLAICFRSGAYRPCVISTFEHERKFYSKMKTCKIFMFTVSWLLFSLLFCVSNMPFQQNMYEITTFAEYFVSRHVQGGKGHLQRKMLELKLSQKVFFLCLKLLAPESVVFRKNKTQQRLTISKIIANTAPQQLDMLLVFS